MSQLFFRLKVAILMATLVACQTQPQRTIVLQPVPPLPVEPEPVAVNVLGDQERQRRYIADILYDGMRALRAERLMTPAEDSAYRHFSRVLALEPDNTVALDGMQDIVLRYLQLADTASRQGQFVNAENFLRRAAQVDDRHPGIEAAYTNLEIERERTHSVHTLSARELRNREASLTQQLQELASIVADINAFVLITAPNDEMGRWIYAQLQEGVTDYRIRGDIEIGEQPSVRLVITQRS